MEMFEQALRNKFRFSTVKGEVSTEDLWDMPLTSRNNFDLDTVAISLAKQVAETSEMSFVKTTTTASKLLKDKLEVVKYVITTKMAEAESKESAKVKETEREFLKSVLQEKKVDAVKGLSVEELEARLASL